MVKNCLVVTTTITGYFILAVVGQQNFGCFETKLIVLWHPTKMQLLLWRWGA